MNPHPVGYASPKQAGRPSLYAETAMNGAENQADSILGELEDSSSRRKKVIAVFAIALLSAAAIGWLQAGGFARHWDTGFLELAAPADAGKAPGTDVAAVAVNKSALQIADSRLDEAKRQPAEEKIVMSATIVKDNASAPDTQEANSSGQAPADPAIAAQEVEKSLNTVVQPVITGPAPAQGPITQASMPASRVVTMVPADIAPAAAIVTTPARERHAAHADTPLAARMPPAGKPQSTSARELNIVRKAPVKGKHAEKDGDVELIAALLNRVSSKTEPAGAQVSRQPGAAGAPQRAAASEQKKSRKTAGAGMRDNHVSRPLNPTESALKRCLGLGFFESELCRFQACSGRWGRDPACPESAQASSATP